jgi:hypothetical protein
VRLAKLRNPAAPAARREALKTGAAQAARSSILLAVMLGEGSPHMWPLREHRAQIVVERNDSFSPPPGANEVPLPAALPLFATVLAGGGLVAWRRERKAAKLATH